MFLARSRPTVVTCMGWLLSIADSDTCSMARCDAGSGSHPPHLLSLHRINTLVPESNYWTPPAPPERRNRPKQAIADAVNSCDAASPDRTFAEQVAQTALRASFVPRVNFPDSVCPSLQAAFRAATPCLEADDCLPFGIGGGKDRWKREERS